MDKGYSMRRRLIGILMAGSVMASPLAALSATSAAQETEKPVLASSLAGAVLSAQVAERDNDFKAAIAFYQQALGFDPGNATYQQSLMMALLTNGDFDEALPYAERLKAVPEVERVSRVALAVNAIGNEDWIQAEALLKLSLQSDLDRLVTGLMSAWVKKGNNDLDGALASIKALDGPDWFDLFKRIHKALILDASGKVPEARTAYQEALDSPDAGAAPEAWLRSLESFAGFEMRAANKDAALAILDRGDDFANDRPSLKALRKEIQASASLPLMVSSAKEGAAEVLFGIGTAIRREGSEAFSKLYLQLALAARPNADVTLVQLAGLAEDLNQQAEAIDLYRLVPPNSPFKRSAELQLGLNLADLDKTDEAVRHLTLLLDADQTDVRAYLALGGVYGAKKNFKAAAEVYDRAEKSLVAPLRSHWNLFYQRGIAYEQLDIWPKAEASFRKALQLYPDQPQVLNYLGYSYVDQNTNLEEALNMIRKAVELRPDDGYIVDSLGWAYYRLGRFEEAANELERAIKLRPEDATINDHLGDAYWRVGRKLEARFQWQHALDGKPEEPELTKITTKLKAPEPVVAEANADKKG
jgi:tetratricopeptide (TPR) repeat protein